MTGSVVPFPDRSAILIDRSPFGGFEVEPHLCPAVSGMGSWFASFLDAFDYAEHLAREAGTSAFLMCDVPEGGAA